MLNLDIKSIDKSQLTSGAFNPTEDVKEAKEILNNYEDEYEPKVEADFNQNIWYFKIISSGRSVKFNFSIIEDLLRFTNVRDKQHFFLATKCWTAKQIAKFSMADVRKSFDNLISAIYTTNAYDQSNLTKWEQMLEEKIIHRRKSKTTKFVKKEVSGSVLAKYVETSLDFLYFYHQGQFRPFILTLSDINDDFTYSMKNIRTIPTAISVIKFKRYLDKWFELKLIQTDLNSTKELICYYPIILWFKLCMIIPMRPSEFCLIKRDALSKENNTLSFPRLKQKKNEQLKYETLPIPEELVALFEHYIELTDEYGKTDYMLHLQAFANVARKEWYRSFDELKIFDRLMLKECLGKFYKNIIFNQFRVNVQNGMSYFDLEAKKSDALFSSVSNDNIETALKLGDLRHIAIINMMLQGYDTVEIRYLAGHITSETQESYYSHMQFWMETEIKRLAVELHDFENTLQAASSDEFFSVDPKVFEKIEEWRANIFIEGETNENEFEKLDIGYCKDEQMRCPTFNYKHKGCYFCKYWGISEAQLDEREEIIMGDLNNIYNQIMEKVNFMKTLLRKINTGNGKIKQDLSTTSQEVKEGLGHITKLVLMLGVDKNE